IDQRTRSIVSDISVEVAEKDRIYDPEIESIAEGALAQAILLPEGDRVRLLLEGILGTFVAQESLELQVGETGRISVPTYDQILVDRSLLMTLGERVELGFGPDVRDADGKRYRTRAWVRVDELKAP
ncbi:MAG: hypothetical protein R3F30_14495, partial [Planctomycetota bacterium]